MSVPEDVLLALQSMDGYEQMLAMDKIAREHGVSVEQLGAELQSFIQGGVSTESQMNSPQHKMDVFANEPTQKSAPATPRYIDDPSKLRMRYDPSVEGGERQSDVTQAILCPTCSAPLGIPSTRPIKVMCPNCATESLFEN